MTYEYNTYIIIFYYVPTTILTSLQCFNITRVKKKIFTYRVWIFEYFTCFCLHKRVVQNITYELHYLEYENKIQRSWQMMLNFIFVDIYIIDLWIGFCFSLPSLWNFHKNKSKYNNNIMKNLYSIYNIYIMCYYNYYKS